MIGAPKESFWRKLLAVLGSSESAALASPGIECVFCRAPMRTGGRLGLCPGCFASIPWIKEVKCGVCGRYEECPDCKRRKETFFVMNRSAVQYDETMKGLLARYKYRGDERLQHLLGAMLLQAYNHYAKENVSSGGKFDYITYVPLSPDRLKERGFNQAEQMAKAFGETLNLPVVSLLTRVRNTGKQSFKKRTERLSDLSGAFAPDPDGINRLKDRISDRPIRILVLDDVYTTGSTLNQCAYVIRQSLEAEVFGLCFAR